MSLGFLQGALFTNKAEELDDSHGEGKVKPRDFFWDKAVLFVVSAILGLAAIDVITEFIRGGDVSCFAPHGSELSEDQEAYLNQFCRGSMPSGAYVTAFIVIHAVLLTVPHYLWLNHYGGNFDFFFELSSSLKRLREEGEHVRENLVIVRQLEDTFSTYGRNTIFTLYKVKLVVQLLWSLAGVGFVAVFFLEAFSPNFLCPTNFSNTTSFPFWPLETEVMCVFKALCLLHTLWMAEIALLVLVCFSLCWAFIWCYATHSTELGAKSVAHFSFHSGLAPTYYIPTLSSSCCRASRLFGSVPWILPGLSGHKIHTDLDFLLLKLFRSDYGLGHVFKEVQIEKEIKILAADDQRRQAFHVYIQTRFRADNVNPLVGKNEQAIHERELDEKDFKWRFSKVANEVGVYRGFKTLSRAHRLLLTDTMHGAILAFGQRAPHNKNAISVSFGDIGYATALARVFDRVASLNFCPDYNSDDEVVTVAEYRTMASLIFPENVFSYPTREVNQFVESLHAIWVPTGSKSQFKETGLIVVGPIPKHKDFNVTNLHLLLNEIYGCLTKGAVLLTVKPLKIAGKSVKEEFIDYEPLDPHFLPLRQEPPVFPNDRSQPTEWPARTSVLRTEPDLPQHISPDHEATLPFQFPVTVHCGRTEVKVLFSTYYYTDAEEIVRPQRFDPPGREQPWN